MRNAVASLVFVFAGWLSVPAHADDIAYDPLPLAQCISHGALDPPQIATCKGMGANPCIAAQGDNTIALVLCWDREARTWRQSIDAIVEMLATFPSAHPEALRASQNEWAHWVETECAYRASLFEGGSGAQVEQVQCATDLAIDRTISLNQTRTQLLGYAAQPSR